MNSTDDIISNMLSNARPERGTFTLDHPGLGRTFIYDHVATEGKRYYTPDPSNPDAPNIRPRDAALPHPSLAEVLGEEDPPEPPTSPAPDTAATPGASPPPEDGRPPKRKRRRLYPHELMERKAKRLERAGVRRKPAPLPILPSPMPPPNGKRRGAYGLLAQCEDGIERNVAECWYMLFQANEVAMVHEKLEDHELARRMERLFPLQARTSKSFLNVVRWRNGYNRGSLSCQDGKPPLVSSRRYVRSVIPGCVVITTARGVAVARLAESDPPDAPPVSLLGPTEVKHYMRYFQQWKLEEDHRRALPEAIRRETARLRAEAAIRAGREPIPEVQ